MGNKPKIFQIFYSPETFARLDLGFEPFDNSLPIKPDEFEYGVMRQVYFANPFQHGFSHLGVLSPKFRLKTGWSSECLIDVITKHEEVDIFMFNPHDISSKFFNVWTQGECSHPGLLNLMETIFLDANLDPLALKLRMGSRVECYSNYWLASRRFWDLYMSFAERIYGSIYKSDLIRGKVFSPVRLKNCGHGSVPYFPFIFERIFSTVLTLYGKSFKCLSFNQNV